MDRRKPEQTNHSVQTRVGQRVFALALGYEDLNDCQSLRRDPLLGAAADKLPGETLASALSLIDFEIYQPPAASLP